MSFLSRKPARPGDRDGGAERGDEHDDYDLYASDGYQGGEDEGWSPNQYFSPEGIKGRWAGEHPEGRAGGRGPRDDDGQDGASPRGDAGAGSARADHCGGGPDGKRSIGAGGAHRGGEEEGRRSEKAE